MVNKIDTKLNLIIPLDVENGQVHYIYSTPLPSAVFRAHWLVFSKTFAKVYNEGLHMMAGPRVTALAMRSIAKELGVSDEIELGVFAEMKRLSYLVLPEQGKGWTQVMLDQAITAKLISEEDAEEVENILAFFIVTSSMHRAATRRAILEGAARLWDAQISSSSCSEFIASLPKLTETAPSGARLIRAG